MVATEKENTNRKYPYHYGTVSVLYVVRQVELLDIILVAENNMPKDRLDMATTMVLTVGIW